MAFTPTQSKPIFDCVVLQFCEGFLCLTIKALTTKLNLNTPKKKINKNKNKKLILQKICNNNNNNNNSKRIIFRLIQSERPFSMTRYNTNKQVHNFYQMQSKLSCLWGARDSTYLVLQRGVLPFNK